jgi:3-methylcrotonyl-CoA carboxylase alpha subunit
VDVEGKALHTSRIRKILGLMPFTKLLIANRGEIAVRVMRACHALGIATVAVYSDADRDALHVQLADEAYQIGPAPAPQSYLDAERLVAVARHSGAEAVHPGYGFLSERAHFAAMCRDAGLVFVGPPPEVIALMGSKAAAKQLAESAGVPVVPGYSGQDQHPATLRREAERVGFPLLIKASAGGGGRGMRAVSSAAEFDEALASARREALAAFGDDAVLLEKLVERPRHVEIQVLADAHGNVVHLFERECSIQRRHQKIVEESPSPALSPVLRAEMGAAAVRLARAAGYVNAGTLEFLLDDHGRYYFLEMNTRLQVEHPVTEAVTGLDLVQLQLQIAAGAPLPFRQEDVTQHGHAIEVRVCAEDPLTFLPATGRLALFAPPEGPGIRNDAGVRSGDTLTVHYDPMFAKLIVHAADRPAAIDLLQRSLAHYAALGVTTNLPLLRAIAAHLHFAAGRTTTAFLEESDVAAGLHPPARMPTAGLAAGALAEILAPGETGAPADPWDIQGWAPMRHARRVTLLHADTSYHVDLARTGDTWRITTGDDHYAAHVLAHDATTLVVAFAPLQPGRLGVEEEISGRVSPSPALPEHERVEQLRKEEVSGRVKPFLVFPEREQVERIRIAREGRTRFVLWRGQEYTLRLPMPPSIGDFGAQGGRGGHAGLEAPMPGNVIKVLVREGEQVVAHQPLVVLEAMKIEHVVAAPHAGVVRRLHVAPGAVVAKGAALVEVDAS